MAVKALRIDEAHAAMDLTPKDSLSWDIWSQKYRWNDEKSLLETCKRVVDGIYAKDSNHDEKALALTAMQLGLWIPGGRIIAGAGTAKRVTLMNCFVNQTVPDAMEGIFDSLKIVGLTMQQGGGIGTDFSTLRPENAILKRTYTKASGPLPFMHMWDAGSSTVRSAGDRRGAMMGTISDTHPDMPKFVVAKQKKDALTNFNVSVLVSDAFMEAIAEDEDWMLYFPCEPITRDPELVQYDFDDEETGEHQYVYSMWRARQLWELITKGTYEYSEPGVIFIDRINEENNLWYCEEIRCTNPCGEQPLPPHGTCNLGCVNLARLVTRPFTDDADFDWETLKEVTRIGVRFLDNVIDITGYPLPEQEAEEFSKRRLGLGITGLADCLAELGLRYGGVKAANMAERIMDCIAHSAYEASCNLAKERGSFPLYDGEKLLAPNTFISRRLSRDLQERIRNDGLRNGLILTVAPTGTISIAFGNSSSGLEPVFAHVAKRRVRQERDDVWKEYPSFGYGARLFQQIHGDIPYPGYMVEMKDLSINDHIVMQSRIQRFVDASVSKTINLAKDIDYETFVQVYTLAYNSGCKGCTTYRPSDVRGSILSTDAEEKPQTQSERNGLRKRDSVLSGSTYQLKWPHRTAALYLTVNEDQEGNVIEVLITSKDGREAEWTTALTLMITANLRKGGDNAFIADELSQIQSVNQGAFIGGKYYASLPAYIGQILKDHMNPIPEVTVNGNILYSAKQVQAIAAHELKAGMLVTLEPMGATKCPVCSAPALVHKEGCKTCMSCGFSECG